MVDGGRYEQLIRLLRIARGLEIGGQYNAAKLFRAAAFAQEIQERNGQGIPLGADLDREMEVAIETLQTGGVGPPLLAALRTAQRAAAENRTIPRTEIPEVHACRDCGEVFLGDLPDRCPRCGARPLTFREFLPVYYLQPLTPAQALEALANGPDEVDRVIRGLSEEQLVRRPAPGCWAIRQVLVHLLTAQGLLAGRVEKILAEENPSLTGVAAWKIGEEETLTAAAVLQRYRVSREATVARLRGVSFAEWWRAARHEEFGQVTLLQQASYFARHERYHLPRLEATRRVIEVGV